jgi:hypothetical protein
MRHTRHTTCIDGMKKYIKILVGNLKGRDHLRD